MKHERGSEFEDTPHENLGTLTDLLESIRDLMILKCRLHEQDLHQWFNGIIGGSKNLRRVYGAVDGKSSAAQIAKRLGINQKHVSTALTGLYQAGLLDAITPYKRGFIYRKKPAYECLKLDTIGQDTGNKIRLRTREKHRASQNARTEERVTDGDFQ